ncbi:hypothetical protein [Mariniflexile fucanivorans]|nr:hypothetical protein [Mariniflexile fucanivorans]
MKNSIKLLGLLLLVFLMSCKNESSKSTTIDTPNATNEELTNTTNYKENNGNFNDETYDINKQTDSLNENWNLNDPNRQKLLFSTFDMSQNQIQKYKTALKKWWNEDVENQYDKLSANERIEKERDILKEILDDSQFENYKDWANKNDDR